MSNFETISPAFLIYFLYGASFLVLGLSITIKDMKGSDLLLADNLWLLGMFGFTHGVREWIEIYPLSEGEHLSLSALFQIKAVSVLMMLLSFIFLTQFGLSLLHDRERGRARCALRAIVLLFAAWAVLVAVHGMHGYASRMQMLRWIEIDSRNIFGLAGGLVTGYGLISYSHEIRNLSASIANNLRYAGITFALYGIFTSGFISLWAYRFLPVPVEILRGVSAVLITMFIIRALNIFDVEARRRIEQQTRHLVQAEKLTSLGQLAAGIAHEINNPLTNASLGIQTLRSRLGGIAGEREITEKLDAVERNIDRASAIAQELLQFSRQRESEFVPLNINDVITGSLTLMKHRLMPVIVKQDLSPVPDVLGDKGKLEQVIINILSNALEAMPEGGTIAISTAAREGMVAVRITDTGRGIAEENVSRVFDPFFTTKEVGEGTGLGLSISYGIIRQHHGAIKLDSKIGRGTTVIVSLPIEETYGKDTGRG